MDLSDGLGDAVHQIAEASGVGVTIDAAALPIADEVRSWHQLGGHDLMRTVLTAGDDYELVFTTRSSRRGRFRAARKQMGALPCTRIGVVTKARDVLLSHDGSMHELLRGYEHFDRGVHAQPD
jgi:thiamine-monophosphate kinase